MRTERLSGRRGKEHARARALPYLSNRDDFHSVLRISSGLQGLSDDVAAHGKRKLNFSHFRFGLSAVPLKRSSP